MERCSKALSQIEDGLKALTINVAMVSMETLKEDGVANGERGAGRKGQLLTVPKSRAGEEERRSISPRGGSPNGLYDALDNVGPSSPSPRVEYEEVCTYIALSSVDLNSPLPSVKYEEACAL